RNRAARKRAAAMSGRMARDRCDRFPDFRAAGEFYSWDRTAAHHRGYDRQGACAVTRAQRLRSRTTAECLAAIDEVCTVGIVAPQDLPALIDCLGDQRPAVQRRAAETLATLRARDVPVRALLLAALGSEVPRQRWGAAYALSLDDAPPQEVLPVLLDSLGSDDGDIRWAAANIVARMRNERDTIERLCALL